MVEKMTSTSTSAVMAILPTTSTMEVTIVLVMTAVVGSHEVSIVVIRATKDVTVVVRGHECSGG